MTDPVILNVELAPTEFLTLNQRSFKMATMLQDIGFGDLLNKNDLRGVQKFDVVVSQKMSRSSPDAGLCIHDTAVIEAVVRGDLGYKLACLLRADAKVDNTRGYPVAPAYFIYSYDSDGNFTSVREVPANV